MNVDSTNSDALISADENRQMFDAIVPRYDLLNRLMSLGLDARWRSRAIAALSPSPGSLYLDIGCGTGDLSIELVQKASGAKAVGMDQSLEMLKCAESKAAAAGVGDVVKFEPGDACAMNLRDESFDGIISGFCIRNITQRKKAFTEMVRVVKPGGRIVLLELTMPRGMLARAGHVFYSSCVVRPLGWLLSAGSAYAYLSESISAFPAPVKILEEMREAGMEDVAAVPMSMGAVTVFTARVGGRGRVMR